MTCQLVSLYIERKQKRKLGSTFLKPEKESWGTQRKRKEKNRDIEKRIVCLPKFLTLGFYPASNLKVLVNILLVAKGAVIMEKISEYDFFKTGKDAKGESKTKRAKRWIRCRDAIERYGVSRPTIMAWAKSSGALSKIDATVLIDMEVLDKYVERYRVEGEIY